MPKRSASGIVKPTPEEVQEFTSITGNRKKLRASYETKSKSDKYIKVVERKILGWLQGQRDAEFNNRIQQREGQRFYHGELTMFDEMARKMPKLQDLTVNVVRKSVSHVANSAKTRATNGELWVSGGGPYQEPDKVRIKDEFAKRLYVAQERSEFPWHRNRAIDSACRAGVGYVHTGVMVSPTSGKLDFFCSSPHWENVYADTGVEDMQNAEFAIILTPSDRERLMSWHPEYKQTIAEMSHEYIQTAVADDSELGYYGTPYAITESGARDAHSYRHQCIKGRAYFRETVPMGGTMRNIVLSCQFITDRSFSKVTLLKKPVYTGLSRPPLARLTKEMHSSSLLPYSDLTDDIRGLARTINAMLRNWTRLLASRGAVVNVESLRTADADQVLKVIAKRLQQTVFVLPEYGEKGSVRIEKFTEDAGKLAEGMAILHNMARATSGINPQMLEDSSTNSADLHAKLNREARLAISTFFEYCDRNLTKYVSEEMLAMVERFNGLIDFGAANQNGKMIEMGSDGDTTIEGNRAMFAIRPTSEDLVTEKGHRDMIQAMMSRTQGPELMAYYLLYIKSMNLPDGQSMIDDLKDIALQIGAPLPKSILTPEEQQQQEQSRQQSSQQQQEALKAELEKILAEIRNLDARTQAALVKAAEPPQGEKDRANSDTIKRQTATINQLMGEGAGGEGGGGVPQ